MNLLTSIPYEINTGIFTCKQPSHFFCWIPHSSKVRGNINIKNERKFSTLLILTKQLRIDGNPVLYQSTGKTCAIVVSGSSLEKLDGKGLI